MPHLSPKEIDDIVDAALTHLIEEGLDDIFKPPLLNRPIEEIHLTDPIFQRLLRRYCREFLKKLAIKEFSPPLKLNIPKSRYTYRQASLLDIVDLARYTSIVFALGETIESKRIPREDGIVFSSRFSFGNACCFDRRYNHSEFRRKSDEITKSGKFSVKIYTDISNFFDRLNLHRLESVLGDIGCQKELVIAVNDLLIHWSGRNSYGIPVGCDASRLLAEAMLINVDSRLHESGITFVRYVDDFRIFANDHIEAHEIIHTLINALETEGLFLNAAKTRIHDIESTLPESDEDHNRHTTIEAFEKIDEDAAIPFIAVVGAGYNARIAKYYKKPGEEAIRRLKKYDLVDFAEKLSIDDPKEDDLKEFVKAFIYGNRDNVAPLFHVINRHFHLIAYVSDALIKEQARFTSDERSEIASRFIEIYNRLSGSDYYRLCIARVISHESYRKPGIFHAWLDKLPISTNPAFLKELIGFFGSTLSQRSIRALVRQSGNYHPAVQRIIASYALSSNCLRAERRAWAKNWIISSNDMLIRALCMPFLQEALQHENVEEAAPIQTDESDEKVTA